jgi:hypothetical protein
VIGGYLNGNSVCFTPVEGLNTLTLICTNECDEADTCSVDVTVVLNEAPICTIPDDQTIVQCTPTLVLLPYSATDADGNLTGCVIMSGPGVLVGGNWEYTPSGDEIVTVTIRCTDDCGAYCEDSFTITFDINEAPVCSVPSDQTITQCTPTQVSLPYSATDADGNLTGCVIMSGPGVLVGDNWEYTPLGDEVVTVTIRCTDDCDEYCEDTFTITFELNEAPVCNLPADGSYFVCGDTTFSFPVSATDADGNLTGCTMLSGDGSFDGSTWMFTTTGEATYSATFQCEDACGAVCGGTVTMTIDYNSPPICIVPNDTTFFVGADSTFSFEIFCSDEDGNVDSCVMLSGPGTFDGTYWTFTSSAPGGVYTGEFECYDACGTTDSKGSVVNITVIYNNPPVCNIPPDDTFFVCDDTTFSFPVSATDIDDNLVGCSKLSGPGSFDGSMWTFTSTGPGVYTATFECVDEYGETCGGTTNITVIYNSPPVCTVPVDQTFTQCTPTLVSLPVSATDGDGNLTGCMIMSGPGVLVGGNWEYTPSDDEVVTVTIRCTDDCGEYCEDTFTITFELNEAPVCSVPSDQTIVQCTPTLVSLPYSATDADGNLTGCMIMSGPGVLVGGNWEYTPSDDEVVTVTIRCTDDCGEYCEDTFTITFELNEAPVCDLPADDTYFICGDSTFSFPVSATDADDNLVGCTMLSGDGSFDGSNWTFTATGSGVYSATFECEDACGETCGGTVTMTIEYNNAPVCSLPGDDTYFVCGDTIFSFAVSATDADDNLTGCTMLSGDGSFDGNDWTFTTSGSGVYTAVFECVDDCGATCGGTVNITFNVNEAPVCSVPNDTTIFQCILAQVSLPVSATDSDGNLVGCTILSGPGTLDNGNWIYAPSGDETVSVTIQCSDECGETCEGAFQIIFDLNDPPECQSFSGDYFVCTDSTFSFGLPATDPNGNLVSCEMISGPGNWDSDAWIWTFTSSGSGVYVAEIECVDACGATCQGTIEINVIVNSTPICELPGDTSVFMCVSQEVCLPVSGSDVDGNLVSCEVVNDKGTIENGQWCYTPTQSEMIDIVVRCTDECEAFCEDTFTIEFTINSDPVCNIPDDAEYFICDDTTFNFPVSAFDVDGNLTGCTMITGPGMFDGSTWTFNATATGDYTATFQCEDDCGANCSGTVTVSVTKNSAPVCQVPGQGYLLIGMCEPHSVSLAVGAVDVDVNLMSCVKTAGPGELSGGMWSYTPSGDETVTVTILCTDACGAICEEQFTVEFVVDEMYCVPPVVTIEKTHNAYQGHYEFVSITIENSELEMGGFDFLIAYDASALTFMEATPGQLLEDCGWEYFTYRYGWQGNCEGPCPSGLLRIMAIAETNNGPNHPACFGPSTPDIQELAVIKFYVTNDRTFDCQYIPVKFFWVDCGDNSISNIAGDVLYIDRTIYAYESVLIWDEDDDDEFPEDARPFGVGAPDYCLNPDPDKPSAVRFIDFLFGGVDIVCADSIDARGDLNLNNVENEIADAVLYVNYFIFGLSVFDINTEGQIAASDVNADGRPLTVGDLVFLIRIVTGDALPLAKLSPFANEVSIVTYGEAGALKISAESSVDVGAAYLVFNLENASEEVHVRLASSLGDMKTKYDVVDGQLRVLIYSFGTDRLPAGHNNLLTVECDGGMQLVRAELVDYYGNDLLVSEKGVAKPDHFSLHQNSPNPFNLETRISLTIPDESDWEVIIYNIAGQVVRTYSGESPAGTVTITWDGRDLSGEEVASGIYFYRAAAGDYSGTKKMVLMK